MEGQRARDAIRTVRVSYTDAERTLLAQNSEALPAAQRRALAILEDGTMDVAPEGDLEIVRLLHEARRRSVQQV